MGGQRHAPAALPLGNIRYAWYRRLDGPQGPVWAGSENLAPTEIRSPELPARSESLHRLSYPGPTLYYKRRDFRGGGKNSYLAQNACVDPPYKACLKYFIKIEYPRQVFEKKL